MNPAQEQLSERNTSLKFFKPFSGVGSRAINGPNRNVDACPRQGPACVIPWRVVLRNTGVGSVWSDTTALPLGVVVEKLVEDLAARSATCRSPDLRPPGSHLHAQVGRCARARVLSCRSVSPDTSLSANRVASNTSEDRSQERRSTIIHRLNMRSRVIETRESEPAPRA